MSISKKLASEGACRQCESRVRQLTRHRLVPGRLGGAYTSANVVPLCRECHDAVEKDVDARRRLRPKLHPEEVAYAVRLLKLSWLDRAYPPGEVARTADGVRAEFLHNAMAREAAARVQAERRASEARRA